MVAPKSSITPLELACANITQAKACDVIAFNSHTIRPIVDKFLEMVAARSHRENVLLILVTPGGTADSAYRMARALQACYKRFTVLVPGWCKSAGTLCVLGANEIVMTDLAELGPLDVQLSKRDELGDANSGLVLTEALSTLRDQAFGLYEEYMLQITQSSEGLISFKTASEIAIKMALGLSEPLLRQIDPIQVGETTRSMSIARAYGERLMIRSQNFSSDVLALLIDSYPEHGFVIDRREAKEIFKLVREPDHYELALLAALGQDIKYPPKQPYARYLNNEPTRTKDETQKRTAADKGESTADASARKRGNAGNSRDTETKKGDSPESTKRERFKIVAKKSIGQ